jgi:hypothetical protein
MDFEFENKWKILLSDVSEKFGQPLDVSSLLFLIGVQEVGLEHQKFKKDEKLDLMHVAICRLLEPYGYYTLTGKDKDGWPHFEFNTQLPTLNAEEQQLLIKKSILEYFED